MSLDLVLMGMVIVAGFYMAWNIGANDVANAMGTSVGSGALTLRQAVLIAAVLEFSGAFFFGSHVSETIQTGIIDPHSFASEPLTLAYGMLASLLAAGVWLQIASYYGWPVSTTHTIVGAVVGFGLVFGGFSAVQWQNVGYIISSWIISPLAGGLLAFVIFTLLKRVIFRASDPVKACRWVAPCIVWMIITVLLPLLVFSHGSHEPAPSMISELILSAACGAVGAYLSYLGLNYLIGEQQINIHPSRTAIAELESAQHSLLQATSQLPEAMQMRLYQLTGDIDALKMSLQSEVEASSLAVDPHQTHSMVERIFGYLQIMSACLMAFAHGANDVANAIGPLAAAIAVIQHGAITPGGVIPTWVFTLGASGIVVGLATWGWRVIETIGKKITELTPTRGFAAEFGTALTIVVASRLGMPISTTHTLVGAVIGVGLARGMDALNLGMAREIFISWVVTVPAGAGLTIFFYYILQAVFAVA